MQREVTYDGDCARLKKKYLDRPGKQAFRWVEASGGFIGVRWRGQGVGCLGVG